MHFEARSCFLKQEIRNFKKRLRFKSDGQERMILRHESIIRMILQLDEIHAYVLSWIHAVCMILDPYFILNPFLLRFLQGEQVFKKPCQRCCL